MVPENALGSTPKLTIKAGQKMCPSLTGKMQIYISVDLTLTVLYLKALGVKNVILYDFVQKPSEQSVRHALEVHTI